MRDDMMNPERRGWAVSDQTAAHCGLARHHFRIHRDPLDIFDQEIAEQLRISQGYRIGEVNESFGLR